MKKSTISIFSILVMIGVFLAATVMTAPVRAGMLLSGVTATPDASSKSGIPGSIVTYHLTLTNNDPAPASLTLEGSTVGGWTAPAIVPSSLTVAASSSSTVTINVPIPSSASTGQNDIATILVKDGSSAVVATIQLTTVASNPVVGGRPLLAVNSYNTGSKPVRAGSEFDLSVEVENRGQISALNVVATFEGQDFYPRATGGVKTIGNIEPGGRITFVQPFLGGGALAWQDNATIKATIAYTDPSGTAFTEVFNLTINISSVITYGTPTPKASLRPQLVIPGYKTDVDPLQPGSIFELRLDVKNLGGADCKAVTMILGGGGSAGNDSGTPQAGGVSGSSGDLTNFAPIGSSNLVFVGDIKQGDTVTINQKLVVNVTTQPGAYTLKISFVYDDPKGTRLVDDQVITLLVYSLPQVEVSFYRDPGVIFAGTMNVLPIQVTNLGKKSSVLGNMKVTAKNAEITNGVSLVGALDPGGYFTLDANLLPSVEGPMNIDISINYTDDFNQPRFVTQTLTVEVQPAMEVSPGLEGQPGTGNGTAAPEVITAPETFWAKILRFFKGLFGLGSGVKQQSTPAGGETVPTEIIIKGPPKG